MYWGVMTGGWMRGALDEDVDYYEATVRLMVEHGLNACQWSATALLEMSPARREGLAGLLHEHDVHAVLALRAHWLSADADERSRDTDRCLEAIEALPTMMRTPIFTTTAGRYHRFMRDPSLEEQMDRLAEALAPVAEAAHGAGCPLGIENHGDYYCSDLAGLCERTPHLGVFLDTGNTFLIGEKPLPAVRDAAPYAVGTHFKDHRGSPRFSPLGFEIRGAVPGEGDAGLREAYRTLTDGAPAPDRLAMILEIDRVEGIGPEEALRRAVQFVRTL